jgi:hypothetical protein
MVKRVGDVRDVDLQSQRSGTRDERLDRGAVQHPSPDEFVDRLADTAALLAAQPLHFCGSVTVQLDGRTHAQILA